MRKIFTQPKRAASAWDVGTREQWHREFVGECVSGGERISPRPTTLYAYISSKQRGPLVSTRIRLHGEFVRRTEICILIAF